MSIRLLDLLKQIPSDTEERVEQTRKRLNTTLREAIRKETGLSLNRLSNDPEKNTSSQISVPINLKPGLPKALQDFKFDTNYWLVAILSRYRIHLQQMKTGSNHITPMIKELRRDPRGVEILGGRESHLAPIQQLVDELLHKLDEADPVKRILEVDKDVLGIYAYGLNSRIELYWAVIGFIAGLLGVNVESLTAVVLAHELAHAYTHLGADIDGKRWSTTAFRRAEHALKEGLAQYYTALVCRRINNQIPQTSATYEELLKHQPPAYHTHLKWVSDFTSEEVRFSMLEIRRGESGQVQTFNEALKTARKRLRNRRDSQQQLGIPLSE